MSATIDNRVAAWLDHFKLLVRNPRKPKKIATKPPRSSATPNAMRCQDGCSGDGRKLGSTKRVVSVGCFGEGVSMSSDLRALTKIRLQRAIYFCLHRDSFPETTAECHLRFGAEKFRQNYMSYKSMRRCAHHRGCSLFPISASP